MVAKVGITNGAFSFGSGPERSSAWLERVVWVHEVAGSNPVAPTIYFSDVPDQPSRKLVQTIRNMALFAFRSVAIIFINP